MKQAKAYGSLHMYVCIYLYIYVCMYVCMDSGLVDSGDLKTKLGNG